MSPKDARDSLEATAQFKQWRAAHPDAFLSSIVVVYDDEAEVSLNYFSPSSDTMFTFAKDALPKEDKVLRSSAEIAKLFVDNIIPLKEAHTIAYDLYEKEYGGEHFIKKFAVLQNLEGKVVWNITFVTGAFKTINIRVAQDGTVVSHSQDSLVQFL